MEVVLVKEDMMHEHSFQNFIDVQPAFPYRNKDMEIVRLLCLRTSIIHVSNIIIAF